MKKYKIIVPKVGASNEIGTEVKLFQHEEIVEAKESWQDENMQVFVTNGWAMELKDDAPSDIGEPASVDVIEDEPVRARNDKGHYIADDPSTPDVNEAWEGGEAPEEEPVKPAPKKRGRPKKTTQKNK